MKVTSTAGHGPEGEGQVTKNTSPVGKENNNGQVVNDWEEIGDEDTILLQRTLRSGQSIRYPGHVVVMGDVNPGAEIVAAGNIVVMGNLRGVAHAGAGGDKGALVAAFRLNPTQLRIANHFTRAPDGNHPEPQQPEVARISGGILVIENYHPGSSKAFNL